MSTQEPTIALVHGAFAESASWNPVIERLHHHDTAVVAAHHHGFREVVAVANPLRSLSGDAAYVRDVLRSIEGPIVLVAHSYGGMVITEAGAGLDAVVALVYVNAFAPDHGESALQLSTMFPGAAGAGEFAGAPLTGGGTDLVVQREIYHHRFCADVPEEQAALMGATQRPATLEALSEALPTNAPAWKQIPSWFVLGDQDLIIPPALHRFMADRAGARAPARSPARPTRSASPTPTPSPPRSSRRSPPRCSTPSPHREPVGGGGASAFRGAAAAHPRARPR